MPKLLFFITEDWVFCSHRLPLACAATKEGYEVILITNVQTHGEMIRSAGIRLIPLALQRRSVNPFRELKTVWQLVRMYRSERPDIVHHVAIKPVLYGSVAAWIAGIPRVVNALTGMGHLFISDSKKARILRTIIKRSLGVLLRLRRSQVILQNPDDVKMLVDSGILKEDRVNLIRGAGVSATRFKPTVEPPPPIMTVLPARMLLDKGISEFVAAARMLKSQGCSARFVLVGGQDVENPANISAAQLEAWQEEGAIEWWGHRSDMPAVLAQAHIVCLPSYREGLPKALLEAAACGKAIVATNVPGCREIVRSGVNGLLVGARDAHALAVALRTLIDCPELRSRMGAMGREIVLKDFTEEQIARETLLVYKRLLAH